MLAQEDGLKGKSDKIILNFKHSETGFKKDPLEIGSLVGAITITGSSYPEQNGFIIRFTD